MSTFKILSFLISHTKQRLLINHLKGLKMCIINITKVFTCDKNFDKKNIFFFQVQFLKIFFFRFSFLKNIFFPGSVFKKKIFPGSVFELISQQP